MDITRKTVALAGVGNLGKYVYEELRNQKRFDVVVIARKVKQFKTSSMRFGMC